MVSVLLLSLALSATPEVGKPAPDFRLTVANADSVAKLKGKKEVTLKDLLGQNVVLF